MKKRKLFCEISPLCYKISVKKEHLLHNIKDLLSNEKFADTFEKNPFPAVIKRHSSKIVRKLHGVDIKLQENKRTNMKLFIYYIKNNVGKRKGENVCRG